MQEVFILSCLKLAEEGLGDGEGGLHHLLYLADAQLEIRITLFLNLLLLNPKIFSTLIFRVYWKISWLVLQYCSCRVEANE